MVIISLKNMIAVNKKIIYENENGSAWLNGYRGMEWSIETVDSYYSTGPIADDQTPDKYVEYYINVDEADDYSFESSYFVAKTTKDGLLTDINLEWKPTGGSIGFDNFQIPVLQ